MTVRIGIADDHQLFLKSLSALIDNFRGFEVIIEALNGEILLQKLAVSNDLPDLLLIDVNMPQMDGIKTVTQIASLYPGIKVAALSMKDDDTTIINMLKAGCCSYLLKDIHPDELERALNEINLKGYYNADIINLNYRRLIVKSADEPMLRITDRERVFLRLACSDLTYLQIATQMNLSERTIDGYRESLFEKLKVKSRVGMALEAIRNNLVEI